MIKTLSKAQKMEREKFRIPRSVQDAIPIRRIFADGIFQVGNQYSKTWSFTDINYAIASKEDKTSMFLDYAGADKSCQPVGIYQSAYISGKISVHGALQIGTRRISGLLQQPQNQSKTKGLAACNSQTTSPFGCLNNFYFKIWP